MLSGSNSFANPLPGVPAVESPFFERIFTESLYSEETLRIARDLHDTGYAVLDFPDNSIGEIADRIIADLRGSYDWQGWQNGKYNDLRIADGWRVNQDVHCIAANPCIIDLLSVLYGRRAFPFQTLNFAVGTQQHVHSDSVHFSSNPERFMCGVWVALEDVDLDTGPLLYYPGSHKWPIYTNEHIGLGAVRPSTRALPRLRRYVAGVDRRTSGSAREVLCAQGPSPHLDRQFAARRRQNAGSRPHTLVASHSLLF